MATLAQPNPHPGVSSFDRLSLTVFLAIAFHAIMILGVTFNLTPPENAALTTMEVTLVSNKSQEAPDDAEYLAQANQLGGGDRREKVRDSSPFSNPAPAAERGIAPNSPRALALPPLPRDKTRQEVLTAEQASRKTDSQPMHEPLPVPEARISAAQLFERSQELARLSAKIDQIRKTYAVSPRQTYVRGANAKQYRFASYLDAWRAKVERIGNLNYPQEAVDKGINGSLLLDVAINPDGSLHSVRLLRSSGHKILDDAAKRIVRLAAPYPPLSEEIRKDTDILHIPRVWHFRSGKGLSTSLQ